MSRNTDLLSKLRLVLTQAPETGRHDQGTWIRAAGVGSGDQPQYVRVEDLVALAGRPLPDLSLPEEDSASAICRTRACLAGWTSVLAAPKGTIIDYGSGWLTFPDHGGTRSIQGYAAEQLSHDWEDPYSEGLSDLLENWLFRGDAQRESLIFALDRMIARPDDSDDAIMMAVQDFEWSRRPPNA